ncbi:MAG: DUF1343 domain-containing protein [Spirochaetota bacterium]|jgi:uncharacterized protein YbbC (DUF1343 family)|nr:DUF1343 domain-containing protein [Spirochaetota bacterium]
MQCFLRAQGYIAGALILGFSCAMPLASQNVSPPETAAKQPPKYAHSTVIRHPAMSAEDLAASGNSGVVLPGIDVLAETKFAILRGRRAALISNHTGVNRTGERTADVLFAASRQRGFQLRKLFAPEHGFGGTLDEKFTSMRDEKTGLPVLSLYGQNYAPKPEDLADIDDLIFDIQDIGTRFYTYQATMALAMRVAASRGKRFIVLDRPNPIGGALVQGAIPAPEQCGGLTSIYPIPTRHGMTIAELALLYNEHFGIGCQLAVVAMQGWRRAMLHDETGLVWTHPSPNMRSVEGAVLYPGLGTAETTSLSVGRNVTAVEGTKRKAYPFELYGAAFVDQSRLARELNSALPASKSGISFTPVRFTAGGKQYRGVQAGLRDRKQNNPILAGLHLIKTMLRLYPRDFRLFSGFSKEVGDPKIEARLRAGESPEAIIASWQPALDRFMRLRENYLLYAE